MKKTITKKQREAIDASWERQKAEREKEYTKFDRKYILARLGIYLPNLFASNYNRTRHPFWKQLYDEVSTFDWNRMAKELTTDDLVLLYSNYDSDGIVYEDHNHDWGTSNAYDLDEEDVKDFKEIPCKDPFTVDLALIFWLKWKTIIPF